MWEFSLFLLLIGFLSWFLTGRYRQWAIKNQLMDIPNYRSSHEIPTPRGGGMVFVLLFLFSVFAIDYQSMLPPFLFRSLLFMGASIALLGACDDRWSLSPLVRLIGQCVVSICIMIQPEFYILTKFGYSNLLQAFLGVGYLVWMINMFNFMDGMNGYAVMESIFLALSIVMFGGVVLNPGVSSVLISLCVILFGFGLWNFPKAKIFMGDVGSGFLGGVLGVLSLYWMHINSDAFWLWWILIAVFMVDALWTLLFRISRRQKFWKAHREHAYQHLIRRWNSHTIVTSLAFLLNVGWLLSLAWLLKLELLTNLQALGATYLSLAFICWLSRAGLPEAYT